jgi:hypothetical protein
MNRFSTVELQNTLHWLVDLLGGASWLDSGKTVV